MADPQELDPSTTALVLVDLMDRIVGQPLAPRSGADVVAVGRELAARFRAAGAAVVLIRVERPGVAEQPPGSDLVAGLVADGDIVVVKRAIGGFYGTELHERLQALGVRTLVFGGIATNLGVESTARAASDLGYDLVFASDAMTAFTAPEHDAAVGLNFPRFGTVVPADAVRLAGLRAHERSHRAPDGGRA